MEPGGASGWEGDRGRAGTHPVFERPSIRQSLLSPPAGQREEGQARLTLPAFRSSTPKPPYPGPLPLVTWVNS